MHLIMNVSNVMAVFMVVGHSICLRFSFPSLHVFYVIVIIFNVHAAAPLLTAFVLYCQLFSSIDRILMPTQTKITSKHHSPTLLLLARTFSGMWTLDFGHHIIPPFCASESLNSYHALLFDYILGFYPILLIFITYILIKLHGYNIRPLVMFWQPFHRCFARVKRTWDPKASMVNSFATFLLLSLTKFLFIILLSSK